MSSPAKRRKKNDFKASSKPVRSLDYFFAKQNDKSQTPPPPPPAAEQANSGGSHSSAADAQLTDEELARKIQDEWNREDDGARDQQLSENATSNEDNKAVEAEVKAHPLPQIAARENNTLKLQSTAAAEDTIATAIPFDESPLDFDPSRYVEDLQSHWAADGGHATYALLTRCFLLVNGTQSRIKIVDTLVNLLRTIIEGDPDSLLSAVGVPPCRFCTF